MLLDIQGLSIVTDYYVIASGQSDRQLKAMARDIANLSGLKRRVVVHKLDEQAESGWILLDLGDVLVHLFSPEQRDYYNLEELWQEGKVLLMLQ